MKTLLILLTCLLLASCGNNYITVEYPNGQREQFQDDNAHLYSVGDTVYVQTTTSLYEESIIISRVYWCDTIISGGTGDYYYIWDIKPAIVIK